MKVHRTSINIEREFCRLLCLFLAISIGAGPLGCRNPAHSTLPPSAIAPPGTPVAPLPKGDMYADETVLSPDAVVDAGDTLEVLIQRGTGEEKLTGIVRETGVATLSFVDVEVRGLTIAQAEERIQQKLRPFMRQPQVQLQLKKKAAKIKRVFVFGDVKKPGMHPMSRHMTVMQAVAIADNYNETALLDEIRVIRGNLDRPEILTADLARLLTYGDFSRNLALEENDVVFVPRERLGDAAEAGKKIMPLVTVALAPVYSAFIVTLFVSPPIIR